MRWITARDERPPTHSSNGSSRASTAISRRDENSPRILVRSPMGPNGVTYASKDDKRNAQFVCHLPEGSEHATQAQKIAASMYSGRPSEGKSRGGKLLGESGSALLLEDEAGRVRRERADVGYLQSDSGTRSSANRSFISRKASVRK